LKFVSQAVTDPSPVVMEAVEARILFSDTPWWQSGDAAVGSLQDLNGNVMGSASLDNGLLTVNGTSAGEEIVLGMAYGDPTKAYVRITRCTNPDKCEYASATYTYDRAELTGIVVNAGGGDDYLDFLSFGRALDIPVTLNGDAGDDGFEGNGRSWDENKGGFIGGTTNIGVVMHGGEGNDTLSSGYGPDVLDGGDGDDLIMVRASDKQIKTFVPSNGNDIVRTWSTSGYVDTPMISPAPQPTPTTVPTTAPLTKSQLDTTSAPDPTTAQQPVAAPLPIGASIAPFAANPLLVSDQTLWDA
jgi:hypothetical protein